MSLQYTKSKHCHRKLNQSTVTES